MRVVLDLSVTAHALGGVGRYVRGLAGGLASLAGPETLLLDVCAAHPGSPPDPLADIVLEQRKRPRLRGAGRVSRLLGLDAARLRRELDALGADVFHASGVQPVTPGRCAVVITFYDPSALVCPGWHTPDTVRYAEVEARMAGRGAGILAISGWAASQAAGLFGRGARIGVAGGAADAIFRPGDPDPSVLSGLGLEPGGYLLHVGNFVPRKNIPFLIDCHAKAVSRGLAAPLVLAGAGGWKRPEIGGAAVRTVEAATDETLLALYRGAMALLLPSLHEGLGLPILEALACGCGVVASNASALPETLGVHGMLLDPADGPAWTGAMLELGAGLAAELASRASGAPRPTWAGVAARAMDFYRSLAR